MPTVKSGRVVITCKTYNGATLVGTKAASIIATVPNSPAFQPVPTISSIAEAVAMPNGITVFVQGKSKMEVTSSGVSQYPANNVAEHKVTIAGSNYYGPSDHVGHDGVWHGGSDVDRHGQTRLFGERDTKRHGARLFASVDLKLHSETLARRSGNWALLYLRLRRFGGQQPEHGFMDLALSTFRSDNLDKHYFGHNPVRRINGAHRPRDLEWE